MLICVQGSSEKVFNLADRRIARLLDLAAEYHREGELALCLSTLKTAQQAMDPRRTGARKFLTAWQRAVERESCGLPLLAAPKSWGEIASEISSKVSQSEELLPELLENKSSRRQRLYWLVRGMAGILAFMAGLTAVFFVLSGPLDHFHNYSQAQVPFFRRGIWLAVHIAATLASGIGLMGYGFLAVRKMMAGENLLAPKVKLRGVKTSGPSREQ